MKFEYLEMDDLRSAVGMSQQEFSEAIGCSRRTYVDRLNGNAPKWSAEEVVKASQLNGGLIKLRCNGKVYNLEIKEEIE